MLRSSERYFTATTAADAATTRRRSRSRSFSHLRRRHRQRHHSPPTTSFPANDDDLNDGRAYDDDDDDDSIISPSTLTNDNIILDNVADRTKVSSVEGLTYLQLLNGVDMANDILPPNVLSHICTCYAFALLEEQQQQQQQHEEEEEEEEEKDDTAVDEGDGNGITTIMVVEDELGLDTTTTTAATTAAATTCEFQEAIEYICTMVRSTLSPTNEGRSYITAGAVQRARTQLPIVWLHGVRIDAVADDISDELLLSSSSSSSSSSGSCIGTIPIRYVLECSVDNGTKMLEIPLFALSQEVIKNFFASSSTSSKKKRQRLMQEIETSCDILQDLSSQGTIIISQHRHHSLPYHYIYDIVKVVFLLLLLPLHDHRTITSQNCWCRICSFNRWLRNNKNRMKEVRVMPLDIAGWKRVLLLLMMITITWIELLKTMDYRSIVQ